MRFIAHSKLSASHGWALNEVLPSLVQHPSRQVYINIAHTAKSLRDFPVVRLSRALSEVFFELSASHGWALNEVFPSLVQHPSRQGLCKCYRLYRKIAAQFPCRPFEQST